MAVQRDIYCNLSEGRFVKSNRENSYVNFPSFFHQDRLRLIIHPVELEPSNSPPQGPFSQIDPLGWSLVVKVFSSEGTELAAQNTWTVSGNTLVGSIDCNTVAMSTAVGVASSITGYIEFEFQDADGNKITLGGHQHGGITIYRELITSGTPANLASETYLTEAASRAQFVPKTGEAGGGFTLTSEDGTKTAFVYLDNNGDLQADPIT